MPTSHPTSFGPRYDTWVRRTSRSLDVLSLVFLLAFIADYFVVDPPTWFTAARDGVFALTWVAFAVDYGARVYLADNRRAFVGTHPLDLVVVLFPALRMLRVLRSAAVLAHNLSSGRTALLAQYVGLLVVAVVLLGAVLVYWAEHDAPGANITSLGDSLWWAITTTTTVGYGDTYPVTRIGRFIATFVMVTGIGLVGAVSASIAGWVMQRKAQEESSAGAPAPDAIAAQAREVRSALQELTERQQQLDRLLRADGGPAAGQS
jgi:voltage-gated potassium channel